MAGYFILAAPAATASSSRISSETDVQPQAPLTVHERAEVSRAAGQMLKQLYQARLATANKRKEEALHHVDQALELSKIIKHVMPKYQVHTKIQSGSLVYDDKEQVQPLLVPLYQELDRVNLLEPLAASRRRSVSDISTVGHRKGAEGVVVAASDLDYFSTTMDVKWATAKLWTAKYYLDHGNWDRADEALRRGQDSVSFDAGFTVLPLAKAADNIALAQDMIEAGHIDHAAEALGAASDTLKRYGDSVTGTRKDEVKQMKAEIDKLHKEIASETKLSAAQKSSATKKTAEWWYKLLPWRSNDVCVKGGGHGGTQQCVAR
jgi:hypothetical protein